MRVPLEIRERAARLTTSRPPQVISHSIQPGDIRLVRTDEVSRICVVLKSETGSTAQITLVHSSPEMAMSDDIVVPCDALDFSPGYDVVMQMSLRVLVWAEQLSDVLLGRVSDDILSYFWKKSDVNIPDELKIYRGTYIAGVFDARKQFKSREIEDAASLARDCTTKQLEGLWIGED